MLVTSHSTMVSCKIMPVSQPVKSQQECMVRKLDCLTTLCCQYDACAQTYSCSNSGALKVISHFLHDLLKQEHTCSV